MAVRFGQIRRTIGWPGPALGLGVRLRSDLRRGRCLALSRPGMALLAVALLFGAWLVVAGVFRFVQAFAVPNESAWLRVLLVLLALLSFAVGLFLIRHPVYSLFLLALVLGLFWMIHGFTELFIGFGHSGIPGRGWLLVSGVLSIIAGAIVFFVPGISIFVLSIVLGVWLIFFGVLLVATSIRARSFAH
ncbi:MAG: DUF308 domain-containing protein [Candidatus Dormiibacterota bacterium]